METQTNTTQEEEEEENKGVICPKCKEEITYLYWNKLIPHNGSVSIEGDFGLIYDDEYNCDLQPALTTYLCPECNEILFEDYDDTEVLNFLSGVKK